MIAGHILCALGLLVSGAAISAQDAKPADTEAYGTADVAIRAPVFATPIEAAAAVVGAFPESLEGDQKLTVEARKDGQDPNRLVVIITLENMLDDSTSAQRLTIRLTPVTGGWQRTAYKLESRCPRSPEANEWKVGSCP